MTKSQRQVVLGMAMLEVLIAKTREEIEGSKRKTHRSQALLDAVNDLEDSLTRLQQLYSGVDASNQEMNRMEMGLIMMDAIASGFVPDHKSLELVACVLGQYPGLKTYLSRNLEDRLKPYMLRRRVA